MSEKADTVPSVQDFVEFCANQLDEMKLTPSKREVGKAMFVTLIRRWNARTRPSHSKDSEG